ncbi:HNH endonuclease signature motif containing protein [Pseudoxanthomonas kaohsiungensis]|uniref:HNH endonuclease n=1 Tax=Pseudoxanthomonas kaohsiungensis TaxID=283923 RepID=A0ABW3M0J7_9GAMM|nr:HNH endonuclease [Pseudoxanthomonas kaohsiungensis]
MTRDVRRAPRLGHTRAGEGVDELREQVIRQGRFKRRCAVCSFQFGQWNGFELHHLDGDHTNLSADNVVPICTLCHWPMHLDLVLRELPSDPGLIVYLPEVSQVEMNQLLCATAVHQMQANKADETSRDRTAWALYERIKARSSLVEQVDGKTLRPGLSQIHGMVRVLQECNDARYAERDNWLAGCRYLPPFVELVRRAEEWVQDGAAYAGLPVASWPSIAVVA